MIKKNKKRVVLSKYINCVIKLDRCEPLEVFKKELISRPLFVKISNVNLLVIVFNKEFQQKHIGLTNTRRLHKI